MGLGACSEVWVLSRKGSTTWTDYDMSILPADFGANSMAS